MKPLQKHAYDLGKAIISIDGQMFEYMDVHDWLLLASGINKVDFDVTKYDQCIDYCGIAAEYEYKKEAMAEEFVKNLAIFQFIWGSFEAFLNVLGLPEVPDLSRGRTKVDSPCYYIKCNEKREFKKLRYDQVFSEFRSLAGKFFESSKFQSYFSLKKHISNYSQGLYVIYKIRNHFAHGRANFPVPDRDEEEFNYEANLMALSSRIILLTIQMIILIHHAEKGTTVDCWWTYDFGEEKEEIPLKKVFSEIQTEKDE